MLIFLLPPSEAKKSWGIVAPAWLWQASDLPLEIAAHASQKDLACKGDRYEEWIQLNKNLLDSKALPAGERYTWVMFTAIWIQELNPEAHGYFESHVLIMSGMYGLVWPQELIGNYKLPIHTSWLKKRRGERMTDILLERWAHEEHVTFVDLLPWAHQKMIDVKKIEQAWHEYIYINFYKKDAWEFKKYTHWVKKVKGEWLRDICNKQVSSVEELGKVTDGQIQIIV